MAPIPRADLDMDNPSSDVGDSQDQDSPLRRQFSEPFRPQSTSTQISQSPEPLGKKVKCDWCGKLLELPNDGSISEEELLNSHIATDHPHSNSFGYDGTNDMDIDDMEIEEEEEDDEAMNEASQFEEGEEMYPAENAEGLEGDEEAEAEDADEAELVEAEDAEDAEAGEDAEQSTEQEAAAENPVNEDQSDEPETYRPRGFRAKAADADDSQDERDLFDWLGNPHGSFPEEYQQRLAKWQEGDVDKRLGKYWNVHEATNFSPNYNQDIAKAETTWQHAFRDKPKKKDGPESTVQPTPYKSSNTTKGNFLELGNFQDLVAKLQKPETLSPEELYAATETLAVAMKTWQDEYHALDELHNKVHRHVRLPLSLDAKREQMLGHKKRTGHLLARVPEHDRDFEDKQAGMLYGYKHIYHADNLSLYIQWIHQQPFRQGGFVPTPAQGRKLASKVKPGDRNPDGWKPIVQNGVELVPKAMEEREEEPVIKLTRKRKAAEVEAPKTDEEETQQASENGEETEDDVRQVKRRTRGRGARRATFEAYQPPDPPATSTTRGRGGRARGGRARGRGIGRTVSSRASLDSQPPPTTAPISTRGRGRRGAATVGSTPQPAPANEDPVSLPEISPMPAPIPQPKPAPALKRDPTTEEVEEARRLKIANSKNPKRTKAMLDHWDRFNREGRIRNPKRSKAQIEQDRQHDDKKDAPRAAAGGRGRRKSPSLAPMPTGNLAPRAPAVAPMPGPLVPTLPPIGMMGSERAGGPFPPPGPFTAHLQHHHQQQHQQQQQQQLPPYGAYPYVPYGMGHMPGPHQPPPPPPPHDHHRGV